MNDSIIEPNQSEETIVMYEVSDEALEAAAETGQSKARNVTAAFCSGLESCPA